MPEKRRISVATVVKEGLCTSCGICAGACRHNSISFHYGKERNFPIVDSTSCLQCGLCYEVCPGKGILLSKLSEEICAGEENIRRNIYAGHYIQACVGHSNDKNVRFHSATGGMVTQFLMWLLEKRIIDGAVVVRYKKNRPFESEPFIATTKEEIWESRSSKYVVISMDRVAREIANGSYKNLVVVGLPCMIQGWRQLAKKNNKVRDAIKGYFAIYCSVNKTKHSIDYYPWRYKVKKEDVKRFAFRDDGCMGYMKFTGKDEKVLKKIPYLNFWFGTHSFFANARCSLCIDQLGELADVSFGDIHIEPYSLDSIGTNSIIIRKNQWMNLLRQCQKEGVVTLKEIKMDTLVSSQEYVKTFKKGAGVQANFLLRRMAGKNNPQYDSVSNGKVNLMCLVAEFNKAVMRKIGNCRNLWWLVRLLDGYK